jgi:hypothetical protein
MEEKTEELTLFLLTLDKRFPRLRSLDLASCHRLDGCFELLPFLRWVVDNLQLVSLRLPATGPLAQQLVAWTRGDFMKLDKPPVTSLITALTSNLLRSLEFFAHDQTNLQFPIAHLSSIATQFHQSAATAAVLSNQECIYRLATPRRDSPKILQGGSGWFATAVNFTTLKKDVVTENCQELIANGLADEHISGAFKLSTSLFNSQPMFVQDGGAHVLYFDEGCWAIGVVDEMIDDTADDAEPAAASSPRSTAEHMDAAEHGKTKSKARPYKEVYREVTPSFDLAGKWRQVWSGQFVGPGERTFCLVLQRSMCLC